VGGIATAPEIDPQHVLLDQRFADGVAIDGGGRPTTCWRSVPASLPDATTRWPTAGSKAPNKNSECGPR